MFLKISKHSQENTCGIIFFNKVKGLRSATLQKQRFRHSYFLVNFEKKIWITFYRTPLGNAFCNFKLNNKNTGLMHKMHKNDVYIKVIRRPTIYVTLFYFNNFSLPQDIKVEKQSHGAEEAMIGAL